jgi:hypothetical protein
MLRYKTPVFWDLRVLHLKGTKVGRRENRFVEEKIRSYVLKTMLKGGVTWASAYVRIEGPKLIYPNNQDIRDRCKLWWHNIGKTYIFYKFI